MQRCAAVTAAIGGADALGKPEDRRCLGAERMLGTAAVFTRSRWLAPIVVLVFACGPAASIVQASPAGHPQRPASQVAQRSQRHQIDTGSAPGGSGLRGIGRLAGAGDVRARSLAPGDGEARPGGSAAVSALQRRLAGLGFAPGPIDGRYGPHTEQAVMRLQGAHGLPADGIAGPQTLAALAAPLVALYPGSGYEPGGSGPVKELQRRLAVLGFAPGPVDGRYGPHTEQAVMRFQASRGLRGDGIADSATLARLGESPAVPAQSRRLVRPSQVVRPTSQSASSRSAGLPVRSGAVVRTRGSDGLSFVWALLAAALVLGLLMAIALRKMRGRSVGRLTRPPRPLGQGGGLDSALTDGLASNDGGGRHSDESERQEQRMTASQQSEHHAPIGRIVLDARAPAAAELGGFSAESRLANLQRDAEGAFNLGVLLEREGDTAGALAAYRRADEHDHGPAACNLGVLLEEQSDIAGALDAYQRAAERGDANGAFNLGMLLEGQGDVAGALAAYRRADQHDHGPAACNLGVLLEGQGDAAGALVAYQRAAERGDANGAFNLGSLLEEHGDLSGAEAAYDRARQQESSETRATSLDDSRQPASREEEVTAIATGS